MCVISSLSTVSAAHVHISVERPADKWPEVFGPIPFFVELPYFLPCAVAGSIAIIGAPFPFFISLKSLSLA